MATKIKGGARPMDAHVGQRLKARRLMLNMSQTELGCAGGVSFQQVGKYESGKDRISVSQLQLFANVLMVDVPYFFEGASGEKQKFGRAGLPDCVSEFVALPEARRLMRAFVRIQDRQLRRRITNIVGALAG